MTDFLTRIAERTLGVAKVAQPIIAPLFAPVSTLSTSEPAFLAVDEVIESPDQMQEARRPNIQAVPPHPSLVTRTDQQATYTPEQPIPDTTGNYIQTLVGQPASQLVPSHLENQELSTHVVPNSNAITPITSSMLEQRHFGEEKSVTPLVSPSAQLSEEVTITKEQPINALLGGHVPPTQTQEQHLTVPSEEHPNTSHQGNHPLSGGHPIGVNLTGETSSRVPEGSRVPARGYLSPRQGLPTMDGHAYGALPSMAEVPLAGTLDNSPTLSQQGVYIDETPIQHFAESSAPKGGRFPSMEEHLLVPNQGDRQDHPYTSPTQDVGAPIAVALEDSHAINQHTAGVTEVTSPTPTIHVTIGRIDVRAITPPAPSAHPKPTRSGPTLSLQDYTRQNRGGR